VPLGLPEVAAEIRAADNVGAKNIRCVPYVNIVKEFYVCSVVKEVIVNEIAYGTIS